MHVLVADDNRDTAESIACLLHCWGYETTVFYDGASALEWLQRTPGPVLALLDWNMPGRDGIDICRAVRQNNGRAYVYTMLITGRTDRAQLLDGLNAGADDYLTKPVDPEVLQARLNSGRRILELQEQLLATQHQLEELAMLDPLTGLLNRRAIMAAAEQALAQSRRQGHSLSIIMADIDHFKLINDTHGHLIGDRVLQQTGNLLRQSLRGYDQIGRFGGEEFLIVSPGCNLLSANRLAERARARIAQQCEPVNVTISVGVTTWNGQTTVEELLGEADDSLYRAKASGRNCVVMHNEVMPQRSVASDLDGEDRDVSVAGVGLHSD